MNCTECGGRTKVLESRMVSEGWLRRRRECLVCEHRFTTREVVYEAPSKSERAKKAMERDIWSTLK